MQIANGQLISFTIGSGSATGDGTLSAGFTDADKMVLVASWDLPTRGTDYTGEDALCKVEVINTTTVRATRIGTPAEVINVKAYVIQLGADSNVYKGAFSMPNDDAAAQTATANINGGSPMALNDLSNAFCWSYYTHAESGSVDLAPDQCCVQTRFDSTSVIGFERDFGREAIDGVWFAVESSTLTVQHLTSLFTATANTTETAAITTVADINDTFILSSFWTSKEQYNDEALWTMHLNSDSQLLFTRGFGASSDVEFNTQIIQDSSIATQRGQWTGTGTTESTALSPSVDVDLTIVITGGGRPFHVAGEQYSGGHLDEFFYAADIPVGGATVDGASTAAPGAKTLGWQTVQFTAEGGTPPAARRVMVIS